MAICKGRGGWVMWALDSAPDIMHISAVRECDHVVYDWDGAYAWCLEKAAAQQDHNLRLLELVRTKKTRSGRRYHYLEGYQDALAHLAPEL
jgi:hypothetical protein